MAEKQTVLSLVIPPHLKQRLVEIAYSTGVLDLDVLVRVAVERFVTQETSAYSWIRGSTLEQLRNLAPEMTAALGYAVVTDEDALRELIAHWQRTCEDCYGRRGAKTRGPLQ